MPAFTTIGAPGDDEWFPINIGLDLTPDCTLGGPTGTQEFVNQNAMFFCDLEIVIYSKRATFHDCPKDIGASGAVRQPEKYPAGKAAPQGRALTSHVGQKNQPPGP